MLTRRPGTKIAWILSLQAILVCCGGGGVGVVATSPANGAIDVEPTSSVTVTFVQPEQALGNSEVWVDDGGGPLPGAWTSSGDFRQWTWTPDQELPRGGVLQVRKPAGVIATFTVRELRDEVIYEFPSEVASGALAWPNGRRVAFMGSRVIEVSRVQAVQRSVPLTLDSVPFGDGRFIRFDFDAQQQALICVRASLDGADERIACPANSIWHEINQRGDVALLVPSNVGTSVAWGVWRLPFTATAFELAGNLILAESLIRGFAIDESAAIYVAHYTAGLTVSRFQGSNLAGEHYTRNSLPVDAYCFFAGDGMGVCAHNSASGPELVRFLPGQGFQSIYLGTRAAWSAGAPRGVPVGRMARNGSLHVEFARNTVNPPGQNNQTSWSSYSLRVERDGRSTQVDNGGFLAAGALLGVVTPSRGESWKLAWQDWEFYCRRSRASSPVFELRALHDARPFPVPQTRFFAHDDSGRAVIAYSASGNGRVVVLD